MTPRELITSEIARQYPATADGVTLADRILTRLRYAGFAVVPRVATTEMLTAANALPITKQVDGLVTATAMRYGGDTGLAAPPNSPLEQWWVAMVAAAENAKRTTQSTFWP